MTLPDLWRAATGEGRSAGDLTAGQMSVRAAIVYVAAVVMIRVARRRFIGRNSAIDVVVAVTFGSTLSRGLTGNVPLGPVLAASAVLVGLDWLLAAIAARSDRFDRWVKGAAVELVRDGRPLADRMRAAAVSERDLTESLRLQGKVDDPSDVARASLERNGTVSVIKADPP